MLNHDLIAKDRPRPVLGPDASARPWEHTVDAIRRLQKFTLCTVRADGRPATPLLAVWVMDGMTFTTGADEQKAKNLGRNPQCILTLTPISGTASLVSDPDHRDGIRAGLRLAPDSRGRYLVRDVGPDPLWRDQHVLRPTEHHLRLRQREALRRDALPLRLSQATRHPPCLFTGRDQHGMRPAVARGVARSRLTPAGDGATLGMSANSPRGGGRCGHVDLRPHRHDQG